MWPKLSLNQAEKDAIVACGSGEQDGQANLGCLAYVVEKAAVADLTSPKRKYRLFKPKRKKCQSSGAFFQKHPYKGIVRQQVRQTEGRKGHARVQSNWHKTREEAFECIAAKSVDMERVARL